MANDQIEEVKQKIDIVSVISEYVHLKKAGRNFKGICPFHGEKSPSFMVNQELQIFKCFGCQEGGDVISFLQKIEGLEFGEALQNLAKRVGITLTSYKPSGQEQLKERLYKLMENAADVYHYVLNKHPNGKMALEYALGRGITKEAIEKFKLGYAPEGWSFIVDYLTKKKDYLEKELENAGLLIVGNRGGYDRFRNRLIFPLTNQRGQVVGFAGRVLPGADEKAGGKYINSPETELYHKGDLLYAFDINRSEIKMAKFAVVVEGEIDAIASWQAGIKNVVAIKGSALTERQVELLARVCETVVMALDADLAGDAAARRGIQLAENKGLVVKVVNFGGEGKDPGDIATKEPEKWRKMVDEAIGVYDFYLQSAVKRYGLDAIGKQKIGKELLPIWGAIDDEILRAHYVGKLAEVLGVRDEDVRNQMAKLKIGEKSNAEKVEKSGKITAVKEVEAKEGREAKEARVVMLTVLGKREDEFKKQELFELIKTGIWRRIVEGLMDSGREGLPAELLGKLNEVLMTEEDYSDKAWNEAVKLLELVNIDEDLRNTEDLELVKKLGTRKAKLLKEL